MKQPRTLNSFQKFKIKKIKNLKQLISFRIGLSNGTYHPNADLIWPDTRMGIILAPILNVVLFVLHNGPIKKNFSKTLIFKHN
jgi:hypothetical protein